MYPEKHEESGKSAGGRNQKQSTINAQIVCLQEQRHKKLTPNRQNTEDVGAVKILYVRL